MIFSNSISHSKRTCFKKLYTKTTFSVITINKQQRWRVEGSTFEIQLTLKSAYPVWFFSKRNTSPSSSRSEQLLGFSRLLSCLHCTCGRKKSWSLTAYRLVTTRHRTRHNLNFGFLHVCASDVLPLGLLAL